MKTYQGNRLEIIYQARTTMKTVVNLTNHVYFNLDGHKQWKDLTNQTVAIFADKYTPVDETAIPFGDIADVQGNMVRNHDFHNFAVHKILHEFANIFCVVISNTPRDQFRYKKWKISLKRKFGQRKVSKFVPILQFFIEKNEANKKLMRS